MVRNKQELIAATRDWMTVAKNDLRKHMIAFMQKTRVNADTLAQILDVSVNEVNAVLDGIGVISLEFFAKMLIASNHVIAIMPADGMPPQMGGMRPQRRVGVPPMSRPAMPHEGIREPQPRLANGRFAPRGAQMPPMGNGYNFPAPNPNGQMPSPEELMDMFDVNADANEPILDETLDMDAPNPQVPMEEAANETEANGIVNRLADALRNNPEVANLLRGLLG